MNIDETCLLKNCRIILDVSCRVKSGETVLILMLPPLDSIHKKKIFQEARKKYLHYVKALSKTCVNIGAHPIIIDIMEYYQSQAFKDGYVNGMIKSAMESADVLIGFNIRSSSIFGRLIGEKDSDTGKWRTDKYLNAERRWMELQCNGMDKWNVSPEQIALIPQRTMWLLELVKNATTGHIISPLGTDFTFGFGEGSHAKPILGIVPLYGELAISPRPGSEEGILVIDGPTQGQVRPCNELDREPLRIVIEKGKLKDATGDPSQLRRLKSFIDRGAPKADSVDEVGLVTTQSPDNDVFWWYDGTHHHNTTHVALGNNMNKKQQVHGACHMDGEIVNPTIAIDKMIITKNGIFMDNAILK